MHTKTQKVRSRYSASRDWVENMRVYIMFWTSSHPIFRAYMTPLHYALLEKVVCTVFPTGDPGIVLGGEQPPAARLAGA